MTTQIDRAAKARLLAHLKRKYFAADLGLIITEGNIRIDTVIQNNTTVYNFDITKDSSTSLPESKIDRNDMFVVVQLGGFISQRDNANIGAQILSTYPNEISFPPVAGFTPANLEIFYNANMAFKTAQTELIEKFDTRRFRMVPQTQRTTAVNRDQIAYEDGFVSIIPTYTLDGDKKNNITLTLPGAASEVQSQTSGTDNVFTFYAMGFHIIGGAGSRNAIAELQARFEAEQKSNIARQRSGMKIPRSY